MSTLQYYRLALLQLMRYQTAMEEIIALQDEVDDLRDKVGQYQKKYRRCDREIEKHEQCPLCQRKYGSEVALKLHIKLKHSGVRPTTDPFQELSQLSIDQDGEKENLRRN